MLGIAYSMPPARTGFYGAAGAYASRVNTARRASFVMAAARRMQDAIGRARSTHQPGLIADPLRAERRYYGQHLVTSWAREQAAARIDSTGMLYGPLLGWYTVHTPTTTPECAAADRHNFYADPSRRSAGRAWRTQAAAATRAHRSPARRWSEPPSRFRPGPVYTSEAGVTVGSRC